MGAGKARGKHSLWRKQNHTQDLEAVREKKKKKRPQIKTLKVPEGMKSRHGGEF